MNTWPPKLHGSEFLAAAKIVEKWSREDPSKYCCLQALIYDVDDWAKAHYARAFFTYLFRPEGQDRRLPWWSTLDYESRIIALCLAAEIAKDYL